MNATRGSAPPRSTPSQATRGTSIPWIVTRAQLRAGLPMVAGYWGIMIAIYATIITVVTAVGDTEVSIWATSGGSAPKYFLLAVGVMLSMVFLPVYVGNGVTRRDFTLGISLYVVVVAVVYAVVMTAGFVAEHAIYSAADLMGGLDDPYPVRDVGDGLSTLAAEVCVGIVYLCCGWLMGTCFYRFGSWLGIGLIPLTVLPAVVTEVGFDALWLGYGINNGLGIERPSLAVGVTMAAVSIAVAWTVNFALIRAVAINKVSG
ncbi:hypothetical protein [Phytohabitans suffuscus]|uniref:Uncharacterized protein n=1 Tax=Phytohabitans suffuscus TaxID=624315 RepID=A0A6F8YF78_9ACTN|nr:hypothetical protein [Phytohabitans suffuscus]BCB84628.1 hypothetical protein Psuf_019410 [Phytohabitans suffuscus]